MARYPVLVLVALWAAVSVPLGLAIWPPAAGTPPDQVRPLFLIIGLSEGAAFGLGVVLLALGGRLLREGGRWMPFTSATYLSTAWLLMSWWPHDGLHRSRFGQTFAGLATIDMAFHVTLILGTAVVTVFLIRAIRASGTAEARPATRAAGPPG